MVYVLWDGKYLWTKSGNRIDAPQPFLQYFPPGFALVGELFFGYGHQEFQYAKVVSQNKLPGKDLMQHGHATILNPNCVCTERDGISTLGVGPALMNHVCTMRCQRARVVAFDTPMVMNMRYEERYTLLRQVLASWSLYWIQQKKDIEFLLPLMLIIQYNPNDQGY